MPTHPLISYMESPDGLGQDLLDDANTPGAGSSMTPHGSMGEKPAAPADGSLTADCMFCDQTFQHQDELSPHVLTQHPTTLFGPAVLRVEAQFLTPGERARAPAVEREEDRSCVVCGQAVEDAAELEGHMRKHRDSFTYSCGLCGRRFREPWFLKNHMRTHSGKAGARNKTQLELESPATINDVVVDQAAMPAVSSPYRMCMVCGFFFPNKEGLAEHSKVHSRDLEANEDEGPPVMARVSPKAPTSQQSFLQLLGLQAQPLETGTQPERSARWIAELDPFNTYQAWQLATKGKIAVGPGLAKELGPDTGSDVEDSCSDKEELGEIWSGGRSGKSIKDGFRRELRSRRPGGETPSPEPEPKSLAKEKPTQCKDCGKTFRTYHQLVLHSRVHKKERGGADSPTTSVDGKQGSTGLGEGGLLDRASEGSEDGSEEGGPAETCQSDKSEDGFDTSKLKVLAPSKECSYCGKSFRSNYYLNIHLRTHTGEKPYKCEHCDYAAAQKTSLRYHLDRRHRDASEVGTSAKLASPSPPLGDTKEKATPELAGSTEGMGSGTGASCQRGKSDMPSSGLEVGVSRLVQGESGELTAGTLHCPASADSSRSALLVHLDPKTEGVSIKQESAELPLDLSLKASLSVAVGCVPRSSLITNACPLCAFKTLYPEVLLMHKALVHKDKSDATRKNILRGSALKQKRHTGCPPALEGKDVAPLPHTYSRYPRRTKSPQPQPAKVSEKAPLAQAAKRLPSTEPRRAALPESHPGSPGTRHGIARLPDRQPELNGVYRRDGIIVGIRQSPPEGEGAAFKARQACNGSAWSSCLSARFGNLPQVEFGEPYSKRPKLSSAPGRDPEGSEAPGARRGDGYGRLVLPGQNSSVKGLPQRSPPSRTTQSFAPPKLAPSPVGETDWNVINILRSYSPGDLASLYHPAVAGSSHGGVPSPVPGNRPLLYQHYPTSVLQRRHNLSPMSNAHCGAADKNA